MDKEIEISILEIIQMLWRKAWIIVLCIIVLGGIAFGVSKYMMVPTYSSSITLYVNNNMDSIGTQVNINDINASQKLVATSIEILKSDMVLDKVIGKLGLNCTNDSLRGMISATSLNGTEVLKVTVISEEPQKSVEIANMIAEVAPAEIIRVITAGGVQLIDTAVINGNPVSPNITKVTSLGILLGIMISSLGVIIIELLDSSIKSEKDLRNKYQIPVLGVIPDIIEVIKK